ncbi:MAG: V-type ATP synthase subunit E [Clostridiales bacterium]|nr:V-type ATP synthase subunit E [Clostridiales bacterium]
MTDNIEKIVDTIINEAQEETERIKGSADRKCNEISENTKHDIEDLRAEIERKAEERAQLTVAAKLSTAKINANIEITTAKKTMINECFEHALENIEKKHGKGTVRQDGKMLIDNRFSAIAKTIRSDIEPLLVKTLWEE